jgi:hypothetical protein
MTDQEKALLLGIDAIVANFVALRRPQATGKWRNALALLNVEEAN